MESVALIPWNTQPAAIKLLFQFLNGAIKRKMADMKLEQIATFQFLNGAIKRRKKAAIKLL